MDKKKPTYNLDAFKQAFSTVMALNITSTAIQDAFALGFGKKEILATLQTMTQAHFHKSMTSHVDHRIWQDVYYVPSEVGFLYIKFTADTVTLFKLLSFKEKDNG